MEWRDEGIIVGVRRHGETSAIVEAMTRAHGRHLGLVRGGRSRRLQPMLQPGNRVALHWRARLDEHLGQFAVEPLELLAGSLFDSAAAMYGIQTLAAHLRAIPERDPHPRLFETLAIILDHVGDPALAGELVVRFELAILDELGFGLDLTECAATGSRAGLAFVSPRTGRAVTRSAGEPWAERLLALPSFLDRANGIGADPDGLAQAFRLTGHFLARHVWDARGEAEPKARGAFIAAILKRMKADMAEGASAA